MQAQHKTQKSVLKRSLDLAKHIQHRASGVLPLREWRIKGRFLLSAKRLVSYCGLRLKRLLRLDKSFYPPSPSEVPLDVFMPTVEKDAGMLPYAIKGLRENVLHPINNIYIVGPKEATGVQKVAKQEGCIFVDEKVVLPFNLAEFIYICNGENRAGWIYKMLLNLSADTICKEKNILILDSDTMFVRPQIFLYKGKPLFNLGESYHTPYFKANLKILGLKHRISRSFITHYMLFNADVLKKIRHALQEQVNGQQPWYNAIIDNIDRSEGSSFADYEIYGDFYRERLGLPCILNAWSNTSLEISSFSQFEPLVNAAKKRYGSISFHNYDRN